MQPVESVNVDVASMIIIWIVVTLLVSDKDSVKRRDEEVGHTSWVSLVRVIVSILSIGLSVQTPNSSC